MERGGFRKKKIEKGGDEEKMEIYERKEKGRNERKIREGKKSEGIKERVGK